MIVYFDCVAFREFLDDVSHSSFFTLSPVITLHIFYGVVLWLRKGCAVGSRGSARKAIPVVRQRVGDSRTSELDGL